MIKKQIIVPTLLGATILLLGITGCSGSKSSEVSSPDASGTNVSETNPAKTNSPPEGKGETAERANKREAVRKQIEAVLTPDQLKQLQSKLQQGEKMRKAVLSLNLSADQKTKIDDILKNAYPHRQGESKKN